MPRKTLVLLAIAAAALLAVPRSISASAAAAGIKEEPNDATSEGYRRGGHDSRHDEEHHGKHFVDPSHSRHREPFCVGLWGDLPYSVVQAKPGMANLIDDMNRANLDFTVYTGDWKAGGPINTTATDPSVILTCQDEQYTSAIPGYLGALDAPAMYAAGDNEWTDCDRSGAGVSASAVFNSLNRLSFIRQRLFNDNNFSFGKRKLRLDVQSDMCYGWAGQGNPNNITAGAGGYKEEACTENRRWRFNGVTFVTFNQVGSCNNRCKEQPDDKEWAKRNAANIKWVRESFALAKARGDAGIMLISQADPAWVNYAIPDVDGKRDPLTLVLTSAPPDGFFDFMVMLREETLAFKKPVAYVHGDSHYFTVDKPLRKSTGEQIVNFTRVITFGDHQEYGTNAMNWVRVDVNPKSHAVFSFSPIIVAANNPDQVA